MKPKKLTKKLVFTKQVIAILDLPEMGVIKGGETGWECPTVGSCSCGDTCFFTCGDSVKYCC